tara:strand:+ start:241 stop:345 length:105 start_codon:yes stop_codon:yes gene_type:complete
MEEYPVNETSDMPLDNSVPGYPYDESAPIEMEVS